MARIAALNMIVSAAAASGWRVNLAIQSRRGFTLIEVMIVVAIIGLLAAIAYPAYLDQVRAARRTEAKTLLLQAANRQERFYSSNSPNEYAASMKQLGWNANAVETENGWYQVKVSSVAGDGQAYQIRATAQDDQTRDECVRMGIDELGQKTAFDAASGGQGVGEACW